MRPAEVNSDLFLHLNALIDVASSECFWRKLFTRRWEQTGNIDAALAEWKRGPYNPQFLERIGDAVAMIKEDYFERTGIR